MRAGATPDAHAAESAIVIAADRLYQNLPEAEQRLVESVTALEAIRLALQRLEDGAGTVNGVSVELAAAREMSEAVDRALEG